jgi:hypothetical protein
MASAKLRELGALLHLTALRHGQHADLIREQFPLDGELLADSFDKLAAQLNEISDGISDGRYDE